MKDNYGRNIDYMRVSVTDRCNLRCRYCMPEGIECVSMADILTYEEITEVCRKAASLGIRKIKLTGGEPLVRKHLDELVGMLKDIEGIEQVTLTTNGVLLKEALPGLAAAGIDGINISLDTLDEAQYAAITGQNQLARVLESVEAVLAADIPLKINAVAQDGPGTSNWISLAALTKDAPVHVRFIEMMPIGMGKQIACVPNRTIQEVLVAHYGPLRKDGRIHGNGPAEYYRLAGHKGSIGFISAVHGAFCDRCNRVRLTAEGQLKPCLCYAESFDLREILRRQPYDEEALRSRLAAAIQSKPQAHCFAAAQTVSETREMVRIGG